MRFATPSPFAELVTRAQAGPTSIFCPPYTNQDQDQDQDQDPGPRTQDQDPGPCSVPLHSFALD